MDIVQKGQYLRYIFTVYSLDYYLTLVSFFSVSPYKLYHYCVQIKSCNIYIHIIHGGDQSLPKIQR